jgi:hypothetical protein
LTVVLIQLPWPLSALIWLNKLLEVIRPVT